ncbi:esterase family protein [Streptomyces actuosus]|uniref:Esterase family protein n=1 Tax=Streptomyces actuosus TaxID=1885 RepID=A0ABS2VKI7_STRAS|nr:alpha/beta hydrolase family protein [Streptomyces actuosus]MBN0043603.1 esterase family protein [Streptomyces actuosus]
MQDLTVASPAMGASIPVRVILPRSWYSKKRARFPVLYMLHGGNDDYTSWTRETDVEQLAAGSDVLIVMPDGGKTGYYSNWFDGGPRWETFHTSELVRLMEERYRASSSRAVIGLSMGGFGALNYAAHHQGMFRYVAAMSSYVDLADPGVWVVLGLGAARDGVDIKRVWGDPVRNADVWQAHNPASMPRAFQGTRVHLSAGDGMPGPLDAGRATDVLVMGAVGEALLPEPIRKFAASLRSVGVDATTHLYKPGTHSWPYWERELHAIWPDVMASLGKHAWAGHLRPDHDPQKARLVPAAG